MKIKPTAGVNLRLPAYETPKNQWLYMQNVDMLHDETFTQILGSTKYHGTSLGTSAASALMTYYNNDLTVARELAVVDDKILLKSEGKNEFDAVLISGLTPNKIRFYVNIDNKMYIASPDGLLEYDGVTTITKVKNGPKIKDIIFSKETNRCFALSAEIPNQVLYTEDLSTMGGVPITWSALNSDIVPPTDGDVIEKLGFLNGRLIYFMTNSTWIEYVNGAPTNWRYEKSPTVVGWIAPKTIQQVGQEFWGLGFSPKLGRGLFAFNGLTSRLLSYDVEPIMYRINENLIQEACAEHVNNIYKFSFALDSAIENSHTFHVDTINKNTETDLPNFYGPHTYGFNASTVLNTRIFKGEHLFAKKYNGGSWVFKVDNVRTQYGDPMLENGELIAPILLTGIYSREEVGGETYDETWYKRFSNIFLYYPPKGTWAVKVEMFRDFMGEVYTSYSEYLDTEKSSLEGITLGTDPLSEYSYSVKLGTVHILSQGIQFKLSSYTVAAKMGLSYLSYDAKPVRRVKNVQKTYIN